MSVIRWEEPPPDLRNKPGKRTKWYAVAARLRSSPGEWAVVEVKPTSQLAASTAAWLRSGRAVGMPPGEFEVVSRTVDGEPRVYARYVGEATS